jgi:hypothetical protein
LKQASTSLIVAASNGSYDQRGLAVAEVESTIGINNASTARNTGPSCELLGAPSDDSLYESIDFSGFNVHGEFLPNLTQTSTVDNLCPTASQTSREDMRVYHQDLCPAEPNAINRIESPHGYTMATDCTPHPSLNLGISVLGNPPPDITPYLGCTAYSVAGQLYWGSVAFAYAASKAVNCRDPLPDAVAAINSLYGRAVHLVPIEEIIWLLQLRIAFRKSDVLGIEYYEKKRRTTMATGVLLGLRSRARTDYLDSFEVELELRNRLGSDFAVIEAALRNHGGGSECSSLARALLGTMVRRAICWGDGPRWDSDAVSNLVDQFLAAKAA